MKKLIIILLLSLSACTPTIGQDFIGQKQSVVEKRFGKPTVSRTENPNKILSYRIDDCSLLFYFDKSGTVQYVDHSGNCP